MEVWGQLSSDLSGLWADDRYRHLVRDCTLHVKNNLLGLTLRQFHPMRILEPIAAGVLIALLLPLIVLVSLGVAVAGRWPLYCRDVVTETGARTERLRFNVPAGWTASVLESSSVMWLPTLFRVVFMRAGLRDLTPATKKRGR